MHRHSDNYGASLCVVCAVGGNSNCIHCSSVSSNTEEQGGVQNVWSPKVCESVGMTGHR